MSTRIVILAAGKSMRMNSGVPKVLTPLKEKPLIHYLLEAVKASGVDPRPVVVVGHERERVRAVLGDRYEYVVQEEQLGTGHAVRCAKKVLSGNADAVVVFYGDHPFVTVSTILKLNALHAREGCVLTMMTSTVPDFNEWRAPLYDFGRVIRDGRGEIESVVEVKDATPAELAIKEVNPSFFCFNAGWLWEHLEKLNNNNAKHEYYLTDLVRIAIDGGERIASLDISPLESIGVNTLEQLELVQHLH